MAVRMGGRKRSKQVSIQMQTEFTQTHSNFFESVNTCAIEDRYRIFGEFWCFDFLQDTQCSIRQIEIPPHLDMATWASKLLEKHNSILNKFFTVKNSHISAVESAILNGLATQNTHLQCICECDNLCFAPVVVLDDLRQRDDDNIKKKRDALENISDITTWFAENRDAAPEEKFLELMCRSNVLKNIEMYQKCSDKIAQRISEIEDENLVSRLHEHLKLDAQGYAQMKKRGCKNVLEYLATVCESSKDFQTIHDPIESEFRRQRALWNSLEATPGFEGSDCPTLADFSIVKKVDVFLSGEYKGHPVSEHPDVVGTKGKVDVFCCDPTLVDKIHAYLEKGPSFSNFKKFKEENYVAGSALFFRPNTVGPPSNESKSAFFAPITKCPSSCYDRNQVTRQGLNIHFFLLNYDEDAGEYYVGDQARMESKNSKQRRRLLLNPGCVVAATQLPGKKNIAESSDYITSSFKIFFFISDFDNPTQDLVFYFLQEFSGSVVLRRMET